MSEGTNRGRSSSVRLGEWSARTLMKFMPSGMNAEFLICATFSFGSCGGEGSRSVLVQNRRSTQTTAGTRDEENASAAGAGTHHHLSRHRPRSLRSRREHTERAANARVARRGLPEPKRRPVRVRPVAVSREHPNTVVSMTRSEVVVHRSTRAMGTFFRFDVETRRTRDPPVNDSKLLSDTIRTLDKVTPAEHLCTRRSHAASPAALGGSVGTSSGDSKSSNSGSANAFMGAYPSRRASSPNPESNDPPCTLRR